ncbi:MAG: hypothetical protein ACLGIT_02150, partial [Gammaproteobacteria bacterium]
MPADTPAPPSTALPDEAALRALPDEGALRAVVASTLDDLHPGAPGQPAVLAASVLDRDLGLDSLGRMELLLR